ncbi:MarR family winged helix-turn-helix transcriptional regulator [Clostridium facile]|uniref:MarR family transcriptional regulator n=1 Tax=Clostridium facile TaxID=2763035 RepID=A0ABR7IP51_9CLOT|nr:MarR family transcriptional regulator [Clostridium facile]MBC5786907.1 MarR family transcriptional regulator [Clostridium facile]
MERSDLIQQFSDTREKQVKALFGSLVILNNQLQTLFSQFDSEVTLKQFVLMTMIKEEKEGLTYTQAGKLMGYSRQNAKKLVTTLEEKGLGQVVSSEKDSRAARILPTKLFWEYFDDIQILHQKMLKSLFLSYTDEELKQFFQLFMRLYHGMELFEKEIRGGN